MPYPHKIQYTSKVHIEFYTVCFFLLTTEKSTRTMQIWKQKLFAKYQMGESAFSLDFKCCFFFVAFIICWGNYK